MSEALPLAQVKSRLSEIIGRVNRHHERVTVTVHGRPSAALLAVDDLEALEETIAVLSDNEALRQMAASDAELARGEGGGVEALTSAMERRRDSA
jgi:antitoxin YefM